MTKSFVLALNSGSSSLKFSLFEESEDGELSVAEGAVESDGKGSAEAWIQRGGVRTARREPSWSATDALDCVVEMLGAETLLRVSVAGHRVVHGGPRLIAPVVVDEALLTELRSLVPLAPLHLPASIAGIEALTKRRPELIQVACFDTSFHASLPEVARRLPLPARFADVRRYGFHGLSYEHVLSTLGASVPPCVVIAHLGNGASLAAVRDGRCIDTTMGLTPTGGVLMSTRSGDLDPGVLVHLARAYGLDADGLENVVNRESGLLAVGGASDMKALLKLSETNASARLAIDMFAYSVRKAIGSLAAALGGLELLVFTGGIGERAAPVRTGACRGLEPFGILLDEERNARNEGIISSGSSRVVVRVVKTDEDLVIARHARRLVAARALESTRG